jgi:cyanophycinase
MTWWSLLGSGEFQPWSETADRWLLERADGDGGVLILPTAAAPEGQEVFTSWGAQGLAHFSTLDVPAEVVPLKSRADAEDPSIVARLDRASVVYFSGGNPAYLALTLAGTPFWTRVLDRLDEGMGYAGCSAGVACLAELTFDSATQSLEDVYRPGLGILRGTVLAPHWDIVDTWVPGAGEFIVGSVPEGYVFVGLDEDTAMLGDGTSWQVAGKSGIHVLSRGAWTTYRDGERFDLPLDRGERMNEPPKPPVTAGSIAACPRRGPSPETPRSRNARPRSCVVSARPIPTPRSRSASRTPSSASWRRSCRRSAPTRR